MEIPKEQDELVTISPWIALRDIAQAEVLLARAKDTLFNTKYKRAFSRMEVALKDTQEAFKLVAYGNDVEIGAKDDPRVWQHSMSLY